MINEGLPSSMVCLIQCRLQLGTVGLVACQIFIGRTRVVIFGFGAATFHRLLWETRSNDPARWLREPRRCLATLLDVFEM